MLSLQELKKIVDMPDYNSKIPTAKQLRESGRIIVQEHISRDAVITVYQNGYVVYQVENHTTVFPLNLCGEYWYLSGENKSYLPEQFFENEDWCLRLVMEGEDRIKRNQEKKEYKWSFFYNDLLEDSMATEIQMGSIIEQLILKEMIVEIMQLLSEKQRYILYRYYLLGETQKQISKELGISQQAVSQIISKVIHAAQEKYLANNAFMSIR